VSQRPSGHKRRRHDLYSTPAWVIAEGLVPHFAVRGLLVIDPCCGPGKMVRALEAMGATVAPSDVINHARRFAHLQATTPFRQIDFVASAIAAFLDADALTINPPYGVGGELAERFIEKALRILELADETGHGPRWAAVLLPVDFDAASTRAYLFDGCRRFHAQIVLRRRIEWFKRKPGGSGPSTNHAWFIWTREERAPGVEPRKLYAPLARGL
jgi:predicted RNA methylase